MIADLLPCETKDRGASFSPCGKYRYRLWRIWGGRGIVNFIMLNPSTADETVNDPTIERCERRAAKLGYDGIVVTNLFAFRATDPREMLRAADPVGPENDEVIRKCAAESCLRICAWGNHGHHRSRQKAVEQILFDRKLFCLGTSKTGCPIHPLYVPYDRELAVYRNGD